MHQQVQLGDFSLCSHSRNILLARLDSDLGINREAVNASPKDLMTLTRSASPNRNSHCRRESRWYGLCVSYCSQGSFSVAWDLHPVLEENCRQPPAPLPTPILNRPRPIPWIERSQMLPLFWSATRKCCWLSGNPLRPSVLFGSGHGRLALPWRIFGHYGGRHSSTGHKHCIG